MLRICRAEDGKLFHVNATLRDIEKSRSLELFLQQETGVDSDAVLAYLSDGRRLTSANLRELAGSQDQAIFVFNKQYLDYKLEDVLSQLAVEPEYQPAIEDEIAATPPFRPSQLATSYIAVSNAHLNIINDIVSSTHLQHEALRIASNSLDLNTLATVDTFDGIAALARKELTKQASLLFGLESDLELISRVRIHTEFVSPAVRKAIEAGEKHRTLGDYVSNAKMKQVADGCAQTHEGLQIRFNLVEKSVAVLTEGADSVRVSVSNIKLLGDVDASLRRSQEFLERIKEKTSSLEEPSATVGTVLQELNKLDASLRSELAFVADTKNAYTSIVVSTLRRISLLNNDMIQIPSALASLQENFRRKNSFAHIQRLHNMIYAYGATVIEIVRRKEFARFFYQRAQSILEVMAKLSANERKRRQIYRSEIHGQLPFETRGMEEDVPTIDFSPSGNSDTEYSLERADVDGLIRVLDDLEQVSRKNNDSAAILAVTECREGLRKLVTKMDSLEIGFDKIAERSLLSASRLSHSRRQSYEADERMYNELVDQLRTAQETQSNKETAFQAERDILNVRLRSLQSDLQASNAATDEERSRSDRAERELNQARTQIQSDAIARHALEQRNTELSHNSDSHRSELAKALSEATEQAKIADALRVELAQKQKQFEEVQAMERRNSERVTAILEEQAKNLRLLDEARARGENLENQIQDARRESEQVQTALRESTMEKDRVLRLQATEHDRIMRDHIAEADGDRAVLEHEFMELKALHEKLEHEMKSLKTRTEVGDADTVALRQELQHVEHELQESRHVGRLLREEINTSRVSESDVEHRLEICERLIAQILDVALAFRTSHVKAMRTAQTLASHSSRQTAVLGDSAFSSGMRHGIIGQPEDPSPIDPSDPAAALDVLRAFDHDTFLETINKTGSTIRKWQKQCKEYRERAKGKISFRNFAKGDLALFLPTRNSISKPWAAFNVSFPHYFLQATGHLAEQLKTREWIVARITSITERVVDRDDPTSNPYGLGDGVKYYMLEVEDWTQPATPSKRRGTSRKLLIEPGHDTDDAPAPQPPLPPVPPEAEVEDTFHASQSPNSHAFPTRSRSSSNSGVRPSSLSRLLAQAPPDPSANATTPSDNTILPHSASPSALPNPITLSPLNSDGASLPRINTLAQSPLRPGSRASRLSTTSRFSVSAGRGIALVPGSAVNANKAAATTAISDHVLLSSPSSGEGISVKSTPSPQESVFDGMSNILKGQARRRTSSYHPHSHVSRVSPLVGSESSTSTVIANQAIPSSKSASSALATLANSWGVSFGRRKKSELAAHLGTVESDTDASGSGQPSSASQRLREL